MSARSPILDEQATAFAHALQEQFSIDGDSRFKATRDALKKAAEDFEESIIWRLRDDLSTQLAWITREAAGRAIDAVLKGNQKELERWLSCDRGAYTGRSGEGTFARPIEDAHPVIHGKLFETGALELRKQIVDAHADLLKTQRILDLEDQVRALTARNAKLVGELETTREELLGYQR